ncbi:hypothetical protein WEI85_32295 [Actinomycetes bacterium KLBMP 9797]
MKRRLAVLVAALALLGGCGGDPEGDGVASAGSGAAASPSASAAAAGDETEQMLKFTECMRGEGVQMDDPEPGGGMRFRAGGADQGKVEAAMEKCRQYMPNGGERQRMAPEDIEKARQYSKCMRDNGVAGFPDPDPETGGIMLRGGPGSGLDPESAEFKAAQTKCESLRPRRAGGNG